MYIDGSTAASVTLTNITNALLSSNRAFQGASREDGGAIYFAGGISTIYNTTFADNRAARYGGAVAYKHQCFDFASLPGKYDCAGNVQGVNCSSTSPNETCKVLLAYL